MDFGYWSLLPPFIAIALAIITRRVVLSLLIATFIGSVQLSIGKGSPFSVSGNALVIWTEGHLWPSINNEDHLRVFAFTLMMGAMVGVIRASGGLGALVEWLSKLASGPRGTQVTTWFMGLVIFFDDYANTLLLGSTMQDAFDKQGISRAKLAYLVDSTAAPVAGLALISTWVAGEISYISSGLAKQNLPEGITATSLFLDSIPYRFYVLYCLLLTLVIAVSRRDFGPMLAAEQRAVNAMRKRSSSSKSPNQSPSPSPTPDRPPRHVDASPLRVAAAVVPIVVMVVVTFAIITITGFIATADKPDLSFGERVGDGSSYIGLVYGSLVGWLLGCIFAMATSKESWQMRYKQIVEASFLGAKVTLPAIAILWVAWALSDMSRYHLGTGAYLAEQLQHSKLVSFWSPEMRLALLPTLVFLLCAGCSFAMGTSWGTMAIVMPIAIEVTLGLGDAAALPAVIGSVLAGAIFGDHCSPISDTTVLSSASSGCDHMEHVRTQLPYALLGGGVSVVLGTLPVGFGVSPWICLPIGMICMTATVYLLGRSTENWYEVQ